MRRPSFPLTLVTLLVASVGIIDAAAASAWDQLVLFLAIAVVQVWIVASAAGKRVPVSLRPDLARWAVSRSQRTGQPVTDVVDRAVAQFQHGLYGSGQDDGS